jgi:hypothetical protein
LEVPVFYVDVTCNAPFLSPLSLSSFIQLHFICHVLPSFIFLSFSLVWWSIGLNKLQHYCSDCRIEYSSAVSRELTRLMRIPVDNYNNLLTVLQLQHYGPLLDLFDYHGRKSLAAYLVTNALDNETLVPTQEQVRNWSNLNNLYSSPNIIR